MRSDSHRIQPEHLQAVLSESGVEPLAPRLPATLAGLPLQSPATSILPLAGQVAELERQAIAVAMAAARGNKVMAAKMLGISRAKLYTRLV
jgi:DNA-binding NtrC family response regulator